MATPMKFLLRWTCAQGFPHRICGYQGNAVNSTMQSFHTIQFCRRTTCLVSSSSLCQQMLYTNWYPMKLTTPGLYIIASAKKHESQASVLRTCSNGMCRLVSSQRSSVDSKCGTQVGRDLKQSRHPSHNFSMRHFCSQWNKQNGHSNHPSGIQMCHYFSTKPLYCTLTCGSMRIDNQSLCNVYCRVQAYGSSASDETCDPLSPKSPQFRCYMEHLRKEHQSISETLQDGDPLSESKQKELRALLSHLEAVLEKWQELLSTEAEIVELQHLSQDSGQDKEMKELAACEQEELDAKLVDISQELIDLLMPSEEMDSNDVIMEFSPGVGGQEAMLFAGDMFAMYQRYAAYRGWRFDVLEYFTTDIGGLRYASVSISGDQAYRLLRQEAGVHRVQRVPKTESKGRVHTSTMAVAVLPQPKEIDLKLDPKDLRIETKKASGAGGQHVNTTDSAVRITHLPTGISAESQQERSQHKNRSIAMTMLQTRIYNQILEEQDSSERSLRSSQVGSGGRSEKIRTYNYQQDRVTDHRIARSVHGVAEYLLGSDMLDEMVLTCMEGQEFQNLKERIFEVYEKSVR